MATAWLVEPRRPEVTTRIRSRRSQRCRSRSMRFISYEGWRNDDWRAFLEILCNKSDLHVKLEEVVTKLVAQEAAIKRENGMSAGSDILLFTRSQRES